jgi:hypothetical protein
MRSIFRVGASAQAPPPEISSLRYEISTSPQGGGYELPQKNQGPRTRAPISK